VAAILPDRANPRPSEWTRPPELAPIAATVPLLISEVGESDGGTTFLTTVLDWADARQVGFLAWAWLDDPFNEWSLVTPAGEPRNAAGQAVLDRLLSYR